MEKIHKVKKILKKLKNEKILVLSLPFAILFLPIIFLARFFIIIRFGLVHSDRIGHFASDTALYFLEKKKNKKQKKNN